MLRLVLLLLCLASPDSSGQINSAVGLKRTGNLDPDGLTVERPAGEVHGNLDPNGSQTPPGEQHGNLDPDG